MSGQNTPISTAHSFLSLNSPRKSVEITIHTDTPGLKTMLVGFFSSAKLFAKISRSDEGITKATIQGNPKILSSSLNYLEYLLETQYDAVMVWSEPTAVSEENFVKETESTLKRNPSSGEFWEHDFEEISFGGSASTETFKKIAKDIFTNMIASTNGFDIANKWIPAVPEKHISVKYNEEIFDLEISSMRSLSEVISAVDSLFAQPVPFKTLYRLSDDGAVHQLRDIRALREECLYHALTVDEELPKRDIVKLTTMEELFDKLESTLKDPIKKERQMKEVRDVFDAQGITFKQLMATGDLALTDANLKEIGIAQLGLRVAILAVIKSNQ